jgi:hypothetical protein
MDDRRLHAVTSDGTEIVRYNRAGKWYAERPGLNWRRQIKFSEAIRQACLAGATVRLGIPGGGRFDARIKEMRAVGYAIDVDEAAA